MHPRAWETTKAAFMNIACKICFVYLAWLSVSNYAGGEKGKKYVKITDVSKNMKAVINAKGTHSQYSLNCRH